VTGRDVALPPELLEDLNHFGSTATAVDAAVDELLAHRDRPGTCLHG